MGETRLKALLIAIGVAAALTAALTIFAFAHFGGRLDESEKDRAVLGEAVTALRAQVIAAGEDPVVDSGTIAEALPGPRGPEGIQGPRGPRGPRGEDGKDGADGEPGPPGTSGEDGADGPEGEPGEPGPPGEDGAPGAQGPEGPQGPQGEKGETGSPGEDGQDVESFEFVVAGITYECTDPENDGSFTCQPAE